MLHLVTNTHSPDTQWAGAGPGHHGVQVCHGGRRMVMASNIHEQLLPIIIIIITREEQI